MSNIVSNTTSNLLFKANQIVCLEHQQHCLYGEVIQLIPERKLCWFRPMCIVKLEASSSHCSEQTQPIDLQLGADLLWPISLFRAAVDTEVISWLGQLEEPSNSWQPKTSSRQYLNSFIKSVWQANRDKF